MPVNVSAATVAVRCQWTRRIEAEYRSAAQTQHLVLWLIQLGAPRQLIDEGLCIVTDKLNHGDLCSTVCELAGCTAQPQLDRAQLSLTRLPENTLEFDALGACVSFFCLGETVAVPLFKELRLECSEPTCRKVLDQILRNAVRHRRFGWDLLDHFLRTQVDGRRRTEELLLPFLHQLRCGFSHFPGHATIGTVERAWGLMPVSLYSEIVEETIEGDLRRRFNERSIAMPGN